MLHGLGHLPVDGCARVAAEIARLHRKGPSKALDHRRVGPEKAGDAGAVQCCGHDEQSQILAQRPLRVEGKGEAEIGIEAALVELVEKHGGDAGELRVIQHHAREDALGDDLNAGGASHL